MRRRALESLYRSVAVRNSVCLRHVKAAFRHVVICSFPLVMRYPRSRSCLEPCRTLSSVFPSPVFVERLSKRVSVPRHPLIAPPSGRSARHAPPDRNSRAPRSLFCSSGKRIEQLRMKRKSESTPERQRKESADEARTQVGGAGGKCHARPARVVGDSQNRNDYSL